MLTELSIRDLALIESAEVELAAGLNALTGETGAGKSLLIGALECLLGETPRGGAAAWVRRGADQARVEGRFVIAERAVRERVEALLRAELPELAAELAPARSGGTQPPLELILGRTLGRDGRTRAHVDQRPVPLRALARLAALVLEIHGQNDHQRLFDPLEQTRLFDAFGELQELVASYERARTHWLQRAAELASSEARADERRGRLELLRFQRQELRAAGLLPGEHAALLEEREILRAAGELRAEVGGVTQELFEGEGAALDRVKGGGKVLERWSERVPRLAPALESVREAEIHLADAGEVLRSLLQGIDDDPARLETLEARLAELERLTRKYGCREEELGTLLESLEAELAVLEGPGASAEELAARVAAAREELEHAAGELARRRRTVAPRLEHAVRSALEGLGLPRARFAVALRERAAGGAGDDAARFGPAGTDELEFLLAANPGEDCRSLRTVASFGEAARIMLALRSVLSAADRGRTLVFDEIDSGVGGRLGPEVGAALLRLAEAHQVLCVTHLPAIAALAERHLSLSKEVHAGRTRTTLTVLDGEARVTEVADMIAGGAAEETARAEARRLLGSGREG